MTEFDRFALWLSKPSNCDKVIAVSVGVFAAVWWLTGDYSPIEILRARGGL